MDEFHCDVPQSLNDHFLFIHFKFYESRLCPFSNLVAGCIFYGPDFRNPAKIRGLLIRARAKSATRSPATVVFSFLEKVFSRNFPFLENYNL